MMSSSFVHAFRERERTRLNRRAGLCGFGMIALIVLLLGDVLICAKLERCILPDYMLFLMGIAILVLLLILISVENKLGGSRSGHR